MFLEEERACVEEFALRAEQGIHCVQSRVSVRGGRRGERGRQDPVIESQSLAKFTFYHVVKKRPLRISVRCVP